MTVVPAAFQQRSSSAIEKLLTNPRRSSVPAVPAGSRAGARERKNQHHYTYIFSRAYTNHLERLERWNGVVFINKNSSTIWNAAGTLLERRHES